MKRRFKAVLLFFVALLVYGCGGETTNSTFLWTLNEFADGTPTVVTTNGIVVYRNATNTVVALPNGGSTQYPTGETDTVAGNDGSLIDPTGTGFVIYNPQNPAGLTVTYPTTDLPYDAPKAVDSQGRIYGTRNINASSNSGIWVYDNGTFTVHDPDQIGSFIIRGIDDSDRLLIERFNTGGPANGFLRYSHPDAWTDYGFFALTNLQFQAVDAYGNYAGSNNLGGDLDGTALLWNGTNLATYQALTGDDTAVAYGQIGNRVVGTSTSSPVVWQDGGAESLLELVNFGDKEFVTLIAVTRDRVYFTYRTPLNFTKTGYLSPPNSN